jgi:DNA-binding NarL/FixJ family response regulator
VLIADDHKIVREGLRSLLEKQPDMVVVAEAENGETVLKLVQEIRPDVVLMDIAMPNLNGMEATRRITTIVPETKVIALSMYLDRRFIIGMLSAGALAYLPKDCGTEELIDAIRIVAQGRAYLGTAIVDSVVKDYFNSLSVTGSSAHDVLTARERQILQLLAEGSSIKEIAARLSLSVKTIETHYQKVMNKLNIHTLAELTKYAIREGLTSLDK